MRQLIVAVALLLTGSNLYAQYFVKNLFARYQRSEWLNSRYVHRGANYFPRKCTPNKEARNFWDQSETKLINNSKAMLEKNLWDDEILLLKECVHQDSSFCDAYFRLAQCYVEKTDWVNAYHLLKIAERKLPAEPLVSLGLAQSLHYLDYLTSALSYYQKFEKLLPSSPEGYLGASMCFYELGKPREALDQLHDGLGHGADKSNLSLKVFEAMLYYDLNQTRTAYDLLTTPALNSLSGATTSGYANLIVTGVSPELKGLVNYYTGLCYAARGESWFHKAHRFFKASKKEGIEIDSVVDHTTGFSIRPENQKEQLLSLYEIKDVTSRRSTDTLAQRFFENRKIDDAVVLFQRSLQQDSTNEFAYIKLAECFQLKGKPNQALQIFRLATKKLPRNKYLENLLARQYVRVNDLPAALQIHQGLLKQKPNDSNTRIELCLLLTMMNRKQEALDLLQTVEAKFTNHWKDLPWRIAFTKGEIFYLSGDLEVAAKYLEFAVGPGLLDPYVNYYYGLCLGDLEYLSDAKKYLYKVMEQGAVIDDRTMAKFQLVRK